MATVYADASGVCFCFFRDYQSATDHSAPLVFGGSLSFDELTNTVAVSGLDAELGNHILSGAVLLRGGVPVSIFSADMTYTDRLSIDAIQAILDADNPLTDSQLRKLLRFILSQIGLLDV